MARRSAATTAVRLLVQMDRAQKRVQTAQLRAETRTAQQAERAMKAYQRASAVQQKAEIKERQRLYLESRLAEVELQNEVLEYTINDLSNVLKATLSVDDYFDLDALKKKAVLPLFNPGFLAVETTKPEIRTYLPEPPSGLKKLVPGTQKKHTQKLEKAKQFYE